MSSSYIRSLPQRLAMLACCLGVVVASKAVFAAEPPVTSSNTVTQIGRYSVVVAGPTAGQLDPLSAKAAISIPNDIESVGNALRWILQDSGYRLAADPVLTEEVQTMLKLPLPAVHRRFEPIPIKTVMALVIGPAFQIVQDPVHRLIAFERCITTPIHSSTGEAR